MNAGAGGRVAFTAAMVGMALESPAIYAAMVARPGLVLGVSAIAHSLAGNAPPAVRLTQQGLEHIVFRHWATSGARGAGKFAPGTSLGSLVSMIREAVSKGAARANTGGRPGVILEYNFGRQIDVDMAGNAATRIRVVVMPNGTLTTAFPF